MEWNNSEIFHEWSSPSWLSGRIKTVLQTKGFGFIRPDCELPNGLGQKDVHFYLNKAESEVRAGDQVVFILKDSNPEKPSAQIVRKVGNAVVQQITHESRRRTRSEATCSQRMASSHRSLTPKNMLESNGRLSIAPISFEDLYKDNHSQVSDTRSVNSDEPDTKLASGNEQPGMPQRRSKASKEDFMNQFGQLKGRIVKLAGSTVTILAKTNPSDPESNERKLFYVSQAAIPSGHLSLEEGDEVAFTRSQMNRAQAINPTLFKCARSVEKLECYLGDLMHRVNELSDSRSKSFVVSAVTCLPVWDCIGQCEDLSNDAIAMLNSILMGLDERFTMTENVTSALETLLKTPLFVQRNSRYSRYIQDVLKQNKNDKAEEIYKVMLMMAKQVPAKLKCIVRNLESLATTGTTSFLYKMLKQCVKSSEGDIEDLEWDDLPLVPTVNELLKGSLESELQLRSVNEIGSYASVHDYVDIYFRLLRSDCFSALSKGTKDLLNGKLDTRDMNVYTKVCMAGFQITLSGNGMAIGLSFTPIRQVSNWDQSSCLMYGNLLCISVSGTFRDPIWATVVNRELLQSHKMVVVELCSESNTLPDSEAILSLYLSGKRAIMVESPTYYKAYQPVLKSLQSIDPVDLPFQEELVNCKTGGSPEFIVSHSTFDAGIIYKCRGVEALNVARYGRIGKIMNEELDGNEILDSSQDKAIRECLKSRVAIVQGPPGTGKTFIGIKLIQILLSLSTPPTSPILILTYKNHSLDEFLKELVQIFPNGVARVGGRSQDETLAECNLSALRKTFKMHKDVYEQFLGFKAEINSLQSQMHDTFEELNAYRYFYTDTLIDHLSDDQIREFLLKCPWQKCGKVNYQNATEGGWQEVSKTVPVYVVADLLRKCGDTPIVQLVRSQDNDRDLSGNLSRLLHAAVKYWQPSPSLFQSLSSAFAPPAINPVIAGISEATVTVPNPPEVEADEKDAEETQRERIAAAGQHVKGKEELLKEMKMFSPMKDNAKANRICLMESAIEISKQMSPAMILGVKNIWELDVTDRAKLIQCLLYKQYQEAGERFEKLLEIQQKLIKSKEELESQHRASILQDKKIVGMTITGANINQQLVRQIKPEIVLVEEAAEVLEPQILALLGNWTKHLIMIGDHKQLRPSVENYALVKDYHLDLSMMERLINNKLPFASLTLQNRMRPEFANLLLDIYPHLKSNLSRVGGNNPANCVGSSMFFWSHSDLETSGRSYTNEKEADRAIRLAVFLIHQGYKPEQITILSPYLGQVRLLRRKLKKEEETYPDLFPKPQSTAGDNKKPADNKSVRVLTVDMYQGDENDFVIVSLVRSNDKGKLGFVGILNRRCVAQSRSKCGLYFIGNKATFLKSRNWHYVLKNLADGNHIDDAFPLHCAQHPTSKVLAKSAEDIPSDGTFCKVPCSRWMHCELHKCEKPFHPKHKHGICKAPVTFTFPRCKHAGEKQCSADETKELCQHKVPFVFKNCGHLGYRKCYQKEEDLECFKPCERLVDKCKHPCKLTCGKACNSSPCVVCRQIAEELEKARALLAEQRKQEFLKQVDEEIEAIIRQPAAALDRTDLSNDGDTAAEYFSIEDKVIRYIQPEHNWFPRVTRIEKVRNYALEVKWLKARKMLVDPTHSELKFHGTSVKAVEGIIQDGFQIPGKKRQMYGRGIYFASDSSKSAQKIYTKDSKMLLVCEVLLGKCKTVTSSSPDMTLKSLRQAGYDSLFAKRGTQSEGGVHNDEFVVYDPDQAIPRYIVHYEETDCRSLNLASTLKPNLGLSGQPVFTKFQILPPTRSVRDDDPLQVHFRLAESQFLRLMGRLKRGAGAEVQCVDYYVNPTLERKFNAMHEYMNVKYPNMEESEYILAFHGTKPENIDSIILQNFDVTKLGSGSGDLGYYGAGIYFSEFSHVSIAYGGSGKLLLCKVLPGKTFICQGLMVASSLQHGFDSHGFKQDADGRCEELVIFKSDQILPCYVISYKFLN